MLYCSPQFLDHPVGVYTLSQSQRWSVIVKAAMFGLDTDEVLLKTVCPCVAMFNVFVIGLYLLLSLEFIHLLMFIIVFTSWWLLGVDA